MADERSAILWLRRELGELPLTYQDLQPRFLRERALLREWRTYVEGRGRLKCAGQP